MRVARISAKHYQLYQGDSADRVLHVSNSDLYLLGILHLVPVWAFWNTAGNRP